MSKEWDERTEVLKSIKTAISASLTALSSEAQDASKVALDRDDYSESISQKDKCIGILTAQIAVLRILKEYE